MDNILLTLLVLLLVATLGVLYLNLRFKPQDQNEDKGAEEIANLKTEITSLKDTLNYLYENRKIPSMIDLRYKDGVALDYGK